MGYFHQCLILGISVISITSLLVTASEYKVVCYHTNWSRYRASPATFNIQNIDPFLCTHLIYAFAVFDSYGYLEPNEGSTEYARYQEFNNLKQQNPNLKTLLAVGGWTFGSVAFSNMANSVSLRTTFVNSAVALLREYGFDGLDLDWEYPAQRGGLSYDKDNLVTLSQELHDAFVAESIVSGKSRLLLSAAVPIGKSKVEQGYNVPELDKYLDFYNIMAYDFHGGWDGVTGHNSPLYASSQDFGDDLFLNVNYSVNYWRTSGASKEKIIVGLPAYGRTFTLSSASNYGVGAPASNGPAGQYTGEAGFFSYYEICSEIEKSVGIRVVDDYMKTPYFVKDNVWIGYDDLPTFQLKANYIKDNQFGGMMVWSLALDDFNNMCATGEYPLIKAASQTLNPTSTVGTTQNNNQPGITTNQPTTSKPTTSVVASTLTTTESNADSSEVFSCSGRTDGTYRDPNDCSVFYTCSNGVEHKQTCAHGLQFDTKTSICNWPGQVDC